MPQFRAGKLSNEDLQNLIFPHLGLKREDVLLHASLGEDTAVIDLKGELCVLSSDPITGASRDMGWLSVHIAVNDIAATGAEPVGILLTILMPPDTSKSELEEIMEDASRAASFLGIEIVGGHTEFTPYLPQPVLVATAIGKVPRNGFLSTKGALPGDALYVSKALALEGTAILAREFQEELIPLLGEEIVLKGASFLKEISVMKEGMLSREAGVHALHDITEGGIMAGVWEMIQASGVGAVLEVDSLPIRPETSLICQALGADPFYLLSSGAMLIAAPAESPLKEAFKREGLELTLIGKIIPEKKLFLETGGSLKEFVPEIHEELWRILERRKR